MARTKKSRSPGVAAAGPVEELRAESRLQRVLWIIVGLGIVLRTIAWLGRVELWIDEVAVARNVLERSLWTLLVVPLDFGQTAPKGFLLLEWLVTRVAGDADAALRFIPWAAGVASLFAFRRLDARLLEPTGQIVALLIFAIGQPFIFYSAEAKQYSLDLAISLLLIAETIDVRARSWPRRNVARLAALGLVAVWFSQFAVITLAALGLAVAIIEARRGGRVALRPVLPLLAVWAIAGIAATVVSFQSMFPATLGYMRWFHEVNMPPWPLTEPKSWEWFSNRLRAMTGLDHGWEVRMSWRTAIYPVVAIAGLVVLARRRRAETLLLTAPLLLTLVAVAAHQYPLNARLALVPVAIFVIGIGGLADGIADSGRRVPQWFSWIAASLLVAPAVARLATTPPPYQLETPGFVLRAVNAHWRSGDRLFVPFDAALVTDYYAPRLGWREGTDYLHASCDRGSQQLPGQLGVLDQFRGAERVWVLSDIVSGTRPPLELVYASYVGTFRDSLNPKMPGSFGSDTRQPFDNFRAWLFDFSDSARLAARPPGSFAGRPAPRTGGAVRRNDPRWCYGVFMPHTLESRGEIPRAWR